MQGSHGDATERFRGKKKDSSNKKMNKQDKEFRKRRINRNQTA